MLVSFRSRVMDTNDRRTNWRVNEVAIGNGYVGVARPARREDYRNLSEISPDVLFRPCVPSPRNAIGTPPYEPRAYSPFQGRADGFGTVDGIDFRHRLPTVSSIF